MKLLIGPYPLPCRCRGRPDSRMQPMLRPACLRRRRLVGLVEHGDLSEQDGFAHVSFHRLAAEDVKYEVDLRWSGISLNLCARKTARLELPKRSLKIRGERVRRHRVVNT